MIFRPFGAGSKKPKLDKLGSRTAPGRLTKTRLTRLNDQLTPPNLQSFQHTIAAPNKFGICSTAPTSN